MDDALLFFEGAADEASAGAKAACDGAFAAVPAHEQRGIFGRGVGDVELHDGDSDGTGEGIEEQVDNLRGKIDVGFCLRDERGHLAEDFEAV